MITIAWVISTGSPASDGLEKISLLTGCEWDCDSSRQEEIIIIIKQNWQFWLFYTKQKHLNSSKAIFFFRMSVTAQVISVTDCSDSWIILKKGYTSDDIPIWVLASYQHNVSHWNLLWCWQKFQWRLFSNLGYLKPKLLLNIKKVLFYK